MTRIYIGLSTILTRPQFKALFLIAIAGICSVCLPAFGLWLPWATEQQKVKKALTGIWQAVIANDQRALKPLIAGNSAQLFIDRERRKIKALNIKSYDCKIKSVKVNPGNRSWAFVEYETIAKLGNGKKLATGTISVFQKVGGEWKLWPDFKRRSLFSGIEPEKTGPSDLNQIVTPGAAGRPVVGH